MSIRATSAIGEVTVYRDGTELGTSPVAGFVEYRVPDADSAYRVVAEARRSNAAWREPAPAPPAVCVISSRSSRPGP
ncbi:hypothetical protein GCM10027436_54700 [Actinophytocola sediminis]